MSSYEMNQSRRRLMDIRDKVEKIYTLMGEPDKPPQKRIQMKFGAVRFEEVCLTTEEMLDRIIKNFLDDKNVTQLKRMNELHEII